MLASPVASQFKLTTIFIQPDGAVNPANTPIQRNGDIYTLTGNVYDPILVQKSNITLDGAGYILKGPLSATAINSQIILGLGPSATITVQLHYWIRF